MVDRGFIGDMTSMMRFPAMSEPDCKLLSGKSYLECADCY
jgi:hypothetical protein